MNIDYFKIWFINGTTLFISTQNISNVLKLLLLVVSIGYTVAKWYQLIKKDPDTFPRPFDDHEDNKDKKNISEQ